MTRPVSETELSSSSAGHLVQHVGAGIICGFLAIVQSIGFGMLLLVADLQDLMPIAIGMALFSTAVMAAVAALTSSSPGVVAIAQGIPIAALAGPVSAVIMATGQDAVPPTLVAAVALSTFVIGVAAFLLGRFGMGRFIRFVPFPVIGGFLAGSGWLIFLGGLGVVAGRSVNAGNVLDLIEPTELFRFGAAGLFILAVALLRNRLSISLVVPGVALGAIVLFNAVVLLGGIDETNLYDNGWLISLAGNHALWPPVGVSDLARVDWSAIAGQLSALPAVVVLTVIAVLMNATGIELDTHREVDLDRELKSVGFQNLLGGLGGGMPGFHSVGLTALSNRLGAAHPMIGVIVSGFCFAALFFGDVTLSLVPTPLLGGLLIWIGLALVVRWLIQSFPQLPRWEYLVIVLIFSVIVFVDFASGIVAGVVAAAILFVVEYGRVEIVRHVMTGRDYQSSNDTSEERREVLRSVGDAILIVRLQGFLFFGTADRLRKRIQERIEHEDATKTDYLVIDFRRVSGLDSSSVLSFTRLSQMASASGFDLVLCGMTDEVRKAILRGGFRYEKQHVHFAEDLDHGLERCENDLLGKIAPQVIGGDPVPVLDLLVDVIKDRQLAEALLPQLEKVEIEAGEKLILQNAPSDDIYFVEQGRAAVMLEAKGQPELRVATIGRGSIVGEMAFYLGKPRSASVIAESPILAWRFSIASLERLQDVSPAVAIGFHRGMAGLLADRLTSTNQLARLLAD